MKPHILHIVGHEAPRDGGQHVLAVVPFHSVHECRYTQSQSFHTHIHWYNHIIHCMLHKLTHIHISGTPFFLSQQKHGWGTRCEQR